MAPIGADLAPNGAEFLCFFIPVAPIGADGANWRHLAPNGAEHLAVSAPFGAKWRHLVAVIGDFSGDRVGN